MQTGSKKQGITWGTDLFNKLIETTHSLQTKRISFGHNRKIYGLRKMKDIRLKAAKKKHFRLGIKGLKRLNKYLFYNSMIKLWLQN